MRYAFRVMWRQGRAKNPNYEARRRLFMRFLKHFSLSIPAL